MTSESWVLPEELRMLAEGGDDDLVKEVLAVFQSDTGERVAKMRAACAAENREEVRKQAHALKGSSGQVGAMGLSKICQALEMKAREASREEIETLVGKIEGEFLKVRGEMRAGA
jgi:HPt (histidine-containing phosphotransfer) domain-containing protein